MIEVSRRRALELLAAGAAVGCDRVVIDPGPGPSSISPITPVGEFYVYQHLLVPDVDPSTWTCALLDRGSEIATLDANFLASLAPVEIEHTLQCIGSSPRSPQIGNAHWEGVPLDELLAGLGASVDPSVVEVRFEGADGYHTSIPVEDLVDGRIWLVWRMNGEPLTIEHGAPARFLVRGRYGTKNVKWPVRVELIDAPHTGFWEAQGWSNDASYRQNGFVFAPRDGSVVVGPSVTLVGTAYAGSDPVARVEVSFDDGGSWSDAEVVYGPGPDVWALWRFVAEDLSGRVRARIRVTTEGGRVSGEPSGSDVWSGYDGGMAVEFRVEAG